MDTETLCLCALSFEPATGYDLKLRFEQVYGHFYATGFGSIYPALGRLAEEGLVDFVATPGPGPHPRKRYRITVAGEKALRKRLAAVEPIHRVHSDFLVLMLMADELTPERVDALISQRLEQIDIQLTALEKARACDPDAAPGVDFVRELGRTVLRSSAHYLASHRKALLSALRARQDSHSSRHEPISGETA
jgi:PadR family transcriptional regulator, regulatory protein AphA